MNGGMDGCISSHAFYHEWHGHQLRHLEAVHAYGRQKGKAIIWLLGDSTLDNKVEDKYTVQ